MDKDYFTGYKALSYSLKCHTWTFELNINAYSQPKVYAYTYTSYQPQEMFIKQKVCTCKEVLRKMPLIINLGKFKLKFSFSFYAFKKK